MWGVEDTGEHGSDQTQGSCAGMWAWYTQTLPDFSKEARYLEFHVEFPNLEALCGLNKTSQIQARGHQLDSREWPAGPRLGELLTGQIG